MYLKKKKLGWWKERNIFSHSNQRSWSMFSVCVLACMCMRACVCVCTCFGMILYPQQSVWPPLWSELFSMINGSASMLGRQGNSKPDSPQEFASSPLKFGCVCVCVLLGCGWETLRKDGVGSGKGGRGGPIQSIKHGGFYSALFLLCCFLEFMWHTVMHWRVSLTICVQSKYCFRPIIACKITPVLRATSFSVKSQVPLFTVQWKVLICAWICIRLCVSKLLFLSVFQYVDPWVRPLVHLKLVMSKSMLTRWQLFSWSVVDYMLDRPT